MFKIERKAFSLVEVMLVLIVGTVLAFGMYTGFSKILNIGKSNTVVEKKVPASSLDNNPSIEGINTVIINLLTKKPAKFLALAILISVLFIFFIGRWSDNPRDFSRERRIETDSIDNIPLDQPPENKPVELASVPKDLKVDLVKGKRRIEV